MSERPYEKSLTDNPREFEMSILAISLARHFFEPRGRINNCFLVGKSRKNICFTATAVGR